VDLAVIEALLDGGPDQAVLIDPREALELRCRDRRPQVVAVTGFVADLDLGAGKRHLDHCREFRQVGHGRILELGDYYPDYSDKQAASDLHDRALKRADFAAEAANILIDPTEAGLHFVGEVVQA
jgi:hypothetical protein